MTRLIFLILATTVLSLPLPVSAQNDLALCRLRAQHMARTDAAYQPGVDVHGKPVVPADVSAVPAMIPDVVKIPISIDLAQRLGQVPAGAELKTETGMVEVHRDGRVTYNGVDLTQQTNAVCGGDAGLPAESAASEAGLPPQTLGQSPVEAAPTTMEAARPQPPATETTATDQQNDIIWGEGY
ncbi:MAG: hypothetical protein HYS17_07140 [Micavibrio aeruginosavorus]|uniref:Uncharacterized protein n=1 Tax=Micavibrio aeruginosavorus TaxID=349221 RepID=A0A7T5R0K5_9BACT|nr:MAG: hypothetical protein HYS17_07140 [Micavibrio aeruginosavorus]